MIRMLMIAFLVASSVVSAQTNEVYDGGAMISVALGRNASNGVFKADVDFSNRVHRFTVWGLFGGSGVASAEEQHLRNSYGITCDHVTTNPVGRLKKAFYGAYNRRMKEHLDALYGTNVCHDMYWKYGAWHFETNTQVAFPADYEVVQDFSSSANPHDDAGESQSMETWEYWVKAWARPVLKECAARDGVFTGSRSGMRLRQMFQDVGVPFPEGSWVQYNAERAVLTVHNQRANNHLLRLLICGENHDPGVVRIREAQQSHGP